MRHRLLACSSLLRQWSPRGPRRRHLCLPCPVAVWVAWIIDCWSTQNRAWATARALFLDMTIADRGAAEGYSLYGLGNFAPGAGNGCGIAGSPELPIVVPS